MKAARFDRLGVPHEVVRCDDLPDVGDPAPGEVVFDVLAFPINPADLLLPKGYVGAPKEPVIPGAECIGRIIAVGSAVAGLKVGDHVINLRRENWVQRRRVPASSVVKVRADLPVAQAAMLRINPPTALGLMDLTADLKPGDWIVQNGANAAIGRIIIGLARERGLRTVNIVRNEATAADLKALGADAVIVHGDNLRRRIREAASSEPVSFAFDCVGGMATKTLVECLKDEGTMCVYGLLSGEDYIVPAQPLLYRGVRMATFTIRPFLMRRDRPGIDDIYGAFADRIFDGRIATPVEKIYAIEDIAEAVAHADRPGRTGKIIVMPNGMNP